MTAFTMTNDGKDKIILDVNSIDVVSDEVIKYYQEHTNFERINNHMCYSNETNKIVYVQSAFKVSYDAEFGIILYYHYSL